MNYRKSLESEICRLVKLWNPAAKAYTVGGCVRDELLEEMIKDFDVVIDCPESSNPAVEFTDFLKKSAPNCTNFATYPRFGTSKFTLSMVSGSITRTEEIECVMPRKEHYFEGPRKPSTVEKTTIEEDALRRDFCCNALYKDLETGEILDPTGKGRSDLSKRILRTPLDPKETFKDDPLRMLRAIRFSCSKDFTIAKEVKEAISPIPEYYELSMERVRDEFLKIIVSYKAKEGIWMLHETGLLKHIIPELEESWGFNQNSRYHSMNLTDHTLEVLSRCNSIARPGFASPRKEDIALAVAALLHDISKYRYHEVKKDGYFSFHGHEKLSAEMSDSILTRLKCSNEFIDRVHMLIENHMIIKQFYNPDTDEYTGTDKNIRKLIDKFALYPGVLEDLLTLINADNLSHAPEHCMPGQVSSLMNRMFQLKHPAPSRPAPSFPVSGDDIISKYGIKPGKRIGIIKDIMKDLWFALSGDPTKEDVLTAYEGEFGGKKIWIWKPGWSRSAYASIIKPTWDSVSLEWELGVENVDYRMELDDCEVCLASENHQDLVSLEAVEYPDIYLRCRTHKKSRDLIDKIADLMEEFHQMPGFDGISISLDSGNDLSARVDWVGHKSDFLY